MAEVVERVAKLEEQYDAIMQRFDRVDRDIARVEGRLDTGLAEVKKSIARVEVRLDANLNDVRASITQLGVRVDAGLGEMRAEMRTQFRWFMGGLGGAVMALLLSLFGRAWLAP